MLAILYLALCAVFGICFVGLSVPDVRRLYVACSPSAKAIRHIPNTIFTVPAGIVTGMMCVPFFNYYVTLGLSYLIDNGDICKKLGVLITFAFFLWMILTCLILINRKRVKREDLKASGATTIEDYVSNVPDSLFYGLVILALTITSTFLMFYTYRISGNQLMNGLSTFSDLSPHTAMVASFGKGFNFPTQYMHFSGDGIKYHFLFYFLAGTLQYLGLPIDYALNLPSIMSMVCALVLLGLLAVLISSRRAAFLVAPVLVFFRSSLNVFFHIKELTDAGNTFSGAITEIMASTSWYQVTDYDNWGIWAINVYPNQRHLMLGVAVILIMVILFLPFIRRLCISVSRADGADKIKAIAFSRNAWITRSHDPLYPVSITLLACVLVIVMPYFHGSCLIALLLVLFGMAVFSESRLLYLAVAVCAVASSYIQTLVFSGGYQNVVSFEFLPGFILDKPTFLTLMQYLVIVTGGTLILSAVFAIVVLILDIIHKKPVHRFLLFICFLNPMIFAFLFKVSLEMLANHKFIQVTLILLDALVAALIANMLFIPFKRRKAGNASAEPETDIIVSDIIDADSSDGEVALAAASANKGIRTPTLPSESAFGEPITDDEEPAEKPDFDAADSHTGIDADLAVIKDKLSDEPSDISKKNTEAEEETSEIPEEIVEEALPEELLFGDDSSNKEPEDPEAEAGIAAMAALFGENVSLEETGSEDEDKPADTSEETSAEEKESSVDTAASDKETSADSEEDKTAEEAEAGVAAIAALFGEEVKPSELPVEEKPAETPVIPADTASAATADDDETDDSDDGIMASTPGPAHLSMRPGNEALGLTFGEEPDDAADANVAIESAEEGAAVVTELPAEDIKDEEIRPEATKHEPVQNKKASGLALPAWIALELAGVILALALMVPLTATGVSEWATYVNLNRTPLTVDMNSPVTKWISENTDPDDAFLTPMWSMNRFLLAGRPMYYGWPYYAWSAGHDTYTRDTIYLWLVSGCGDNIDEFTRYCKERHIRYLIADPEFYDADFGNGITFNRQFFEENLTQVAYFAEENTTIYRIY